MLLICKFKLSAEPKLLCFLGRQRGGASGGQKHGKLEVYLSTSSFRPLHNSGRIRYLKVHYHVESITLFCVVYSCSPVPYSSSFLGLTLSRSLVVGIHPDISLVCFKSMSRRSSHFQRLEQEITATSLFASFRRPSSPDLGWSSLQLLASNQLIIDSYIPKNLRWYVTHVKPLTLPAC